MSLLKGTRITWLGHATVLVQTAKGTNLLIDPFITGNPKYPKDFKLPERIDYVLLTHGHGDHISDAVPVATQHGSTVVAVVELAGYIASKGVKKTIGFNIGGTVQLEDVAATMVEATHTAAAQDEKGTHYVGVATGFVLSVGDMKLIAQLYHPEVAMLPIGGFYTMSPKEAALAVELLQPKMVLPIHFGTFPALTGTPKELASRISSGVEVITCAPGETIG
jgi:L-ascorbate metabolism protein UlaG (beta-lactamase superfamily)